MTKYDEAQVTMLHDLEQHLDYEDNLEEAQDSELYFGGWHDGFMAGGVLGIAAGIIMGIVFATALYVYTLGL